MDKRNLAKHVTEKVSEASESALERYSGSVGTRALIISIPYLGSGIDMILSTYGQNVVNRRFTELFEDMKRRMENLEGEAIDKSYVESEEFIDLLIKALDIVAKTRSKEKIDLCSAILTESTVKSKGTDYYSPEEYLNLIADLTPLDLDVLQQLHRFSSSREIQHNQDDVQRGWEEWIKKVCADLNIERADLQLALGRLRASGLVMDSMGSRRIGGVLPDDIPEYVTLSSMKKMMKFLLITG